MSEQTILQGDCLQVMKTFPDKSFDLVLTDPPYPNNAGHFVDGIESANEFLKTFPCSHWFVFWDEMTIPPVPLPLVARHIWHRTNTNRPDNYEAIYEFHSDGQKRASRVLRHSVIFPGLTGIQATGHPTEKNVKLMTELILMSKEDGSILDPFMGSGTTLVAAKLLNRNATGIEISPAYCKISEDRLRQGTLAL